MSGIMPKSPGGLPGSDAGKNYQQEYIRGACLPHPELFRAKLVLALAPIAFLLIFLTPLRVFSQVAARTLSGKVTSESGSGIPSAHLSIRNTYNGSSVSSIGKQDCSYQVSNLAPGNYEVTASAPGFEPASMRVTIRADADAVADFVLHLGKGQAGSSTVSGVLNSQNVTELPLNGRSASDLAALEPGVATARTQSSGQEDMASERK